MNYPWYEIVKGDDIQQGDILENCPVFYVPAEYSSKAITDVTKTWVAEVEQRNVIVMSQTCDMVKGREKIDEVVLCLLWDRSTLAEGYIATKRGMEDARKGNLPAFHLLYKCDIQGFDREIRIVDFRRVRSLPLSFCRKIAAESEKRLRLLPPYREQLSQSLARFFMRVGLPVDIPPFE